MEDFKNLIQSKLGGIEDDVRNIKKYCKKLLDKDGCHCTKKEEGQ